MEEKLKICSVCLSTAPNLLKLTEIDSENLSSLHKLQICIPEIEWHEFFTICQPCATDLDLVYHFREKCFNSDSFRKKQESEDIKIFTPEIIDEIKIETPEVDNVKTETPIEEPPKLKFSCEHCEVLFASKRAATNHSVKVHNVDPKTAKPLVCSICNIRFDTSDNFLKHKNYHKNDRKHICTFCGKTFKKSSDLNVHERIHFNSRDYQCDICDKCFKTYKSLRTHKYVVHTDPTKWLHECNFCSKKFPNKTNYTRHLRQHTNERPFVCLICDKGFMENAVLQKHLLTHTNKREYSCEICNTEYRRKDVRDIHMKKHHGLGNAKVPVKVKKYLCDLCSKTFCDFTKLQRHVRTHTGEKPFMCELCPKTFVDKSYVKQHMKKNHSIEESGEVGHTEAL